MLTINKKVGRNVIPTYSQKVSRVGNPTKKVGGVGNPTCPEKSDYQSDLLKQASSPDFPKTPQCRLSISQI